MSVKSCFNRLFNKHPKERFFHEIETSDNKKNFDNITALSKILHPEHDMWKNKKLKSFAFKEGVIWTENNRVKRVLFEL